MLRKLYISLALAGVALAPTVAMGQLDQFSQGIEIGGDFVGDLSDSDESVVAGNIIIGDPDEIEQIASVDGTLDLTMSNALDSAQGLNVIKGELVIMNADQLATVNNNVKLESTNSEGSASGINVAVNRQ